MQMAVVSDATVESAVTAYTGYMLAHLDPGYIWINGTKSAGLCSRLTNINQLERSDYKLSSASCSSNAYSFCQY